MDWNLECKRCVTFYQSISSLHFSHTKLFCCCVLVATVFSCYVTIVPLSSALSAVEMLACGMFVLRLFTFFFIFTSLGMVRQRKAWHAWVPPVTHVCLLSLGVSLENTWPLLWRKWSTSGKLMVNIIFILSSSVFSLEQHVNDSLHLNCLENCFRMFFVALLMLLMREVHRMWMRVY